MVTVISLDLFAEPVVASLLPLMRYSVLENGFTVNVTVTFKTAY